MTRLPLIVAALLASAAPALAQDALAVSIVETPAVTRSKGTLKTTGTAIAPGLAAAGVHSCAGSSSVGGAGSGFGFSFGSTWAMKGCERRANAASLIGLGQPTAALALLCNDEEVMAAMNQAGRRCPQQEGARVASTGRARTGTPWRD